MKGLEKMYDNVEKINLENLREKLKDIKLKNGEEIPFFNDFITSQNKPASEAGLVVENLEIGGKKYDIYHHDVDPQGKQKERDVKAHRIVLHIKE